MSDKAGSLIVGGGHYRLGNSLASNLHNPTFSSQSLECPASQAQDSKTNLESHKNPESKIDSESTRDLESRFTDSQSSPHRT
ncbi:hypothetical protein [uncultured Helicobacter sp.]|uniref:hypothetical protein n=1 Tax=uncultured Helicobacter sp. TaxID=175537 RepID=UPI00374ED54C